MKLSSPVLKAAVLRRLPSRLLGQTAFLVSRKTTMALAMRDLHHHTFSVLATLEAFGPLSQAELGRRTDVDRSDMTAAVNDLERQGLVARSVDTNDRRQNVISLTEAGIEVFEARSREMDDLQDELFGCLSQSERESLVHMLEKLYDALTD